MYLRNIAYIRTNNERITNVNESDGIVLSKEKRREKSNIKGGKSHEK